MPKNWNRRFKHNRDKMKTGDIFELAEVVRNLSLRDHEKGLSTGEKQMFVKAKKILASELMYAKQMDEDQAAVWLDDVLAGMGANGRKRATKQKVARARLAPYGLEYLGGPRRGRPWRAARRGPPQGFRSSRRTAAPRREPRASRGFRLDRRDRRRLAEGWEEPSILLAEELGCGKVTAIVTGGRAGRSRCASASTRCPKTPWRIVVHDAARPLLPGR